jgi:hypothetical protein
MIVEPSPARRGFLGLILASIVAAHAYCLVLHIEDDLWPFSDYALYENRRDPLRTDQYVLIGVEAGDAAREVDVYLEWQYLRPLYRGVLNDAFEEFVEDQARASTLLRSAAEDSLRRYEDRRRRGLHDGPPLAAMRVYHVVWQFEEADPVTRQPTSRTLLAEARLELSGGPI